MRAYLFITLFSLLPVLAQAQINLVKDIAPGNSSCEIVEFKEANGFLFFLGRTTLGSNSIWRTDGTDAGTILLTSSINQQNLPLVSLANKIFFFGKDSAHGTELWTSDGTTAGTNMVKDIYPGTGNGGAYGLAPVTCNNKFYFVGNDGVHGWELWESDGTAAGTKMCFDLNPNGNAVVNSLSQSNGKVFLEATDGNFNEQFWSTDGTTAGTQLLGHISYTAPMRTLNNKLIFIGNDTLGFTRLWSSDGTPSGTIIIEQTIGQSLSDFLPWNNELYFYDWGNRSLYATDGTPQGLRLVRDSLYGTNTFTYYMLSLFAFQNKLLFRGNFVHPTTNTPLELFETDGTTAGTSLLKDLTPYSVGTTLISSKPCQFTVCGNQLFFKARDTARCDLWKMDATMTQFTKITNPAADPVPASPLGKETFLTDNEKGPMYYYNGSLYFNMRYNTAIGRELYKLAVPNAVTSLSAATSLNIYPNPADDFINIDSDLDRYEVQLINMAGQTVFSENNFRTKTIDLHTLPSGSYTVIVTDGKNKLSQLVSVIHQ